MFFDRATLLNPLEAELRVKAYNQAVYSLQRYPNNQVGRRYKLVTQ